MERRNFCAISEQNDEGEACSTNIQVFKDSLENSINIDSLQEDSIDELSTEEKTRFSNNLKDLKKSYIQSGLGTSNLNCTNAINTTFVEETKKISYKYVSKTELASAECKIQKEQKVVSNDSRTFYWFAAYDKLIKLQNLKKIFDFYSGDDLTYEEFKEQSIILKDFELYFDVNSFLTKPFIRPKKDGFVFLKLYYLSIESINKIYNYINKTEILMKQEDFQKNTGEYHNYSNISNNNISICTIPQNKTTPYSALLNLGSFLNTKIYSFSQNVQTSNTSIISNTLNASNTLNNLNNLNLTSLRCGNTTLNINNVSTTGILSPQSKFDMTRVSTKPKIKNLVKLIKYLTENFPHYSEEFFMYHIYSRHGINSSAKENPNIQIQLTEIKNGLNKKKMKHNYNSEDKVNNLLLNNKYKPLHTIANDNLKNININSSKLIKKPIISLNTFRSIKSNHTKTVSNPSQLNLMKKISLAATQSKNKQIVETKINNHTEKAKNTFTDSYDICNNFASPVESKYRVDLKSQFDNLNVNSAGYLSHNTLRGKENSTNSKIYVVSRDSNIRFKTEFDESVDSSFDYEVSSDNRSKQEKAVKEECYNTPTKKKVFRYYS